MLALVVGAVEVVGVVQVVGVVKVVGVVEVIDADGLLAVAKRWCRSVFIGSISTGIYSVAHQVLPNTSTVSTHQLIGGIDARI